GSRFPRRDDPSVRPLYCASVLLLLKPWRKVVDLKEASEDWETAYGRFYATASDAAKRVISGIQYYYECQSA
ncbi:uncharacterized protein SCHCODRAFT_02466561, partial [Schizophyllum commune H4-8]|uniref:uncharacterized protein n=1 Tax=Schizophyllum commune (strain H4-8 / FGSC 9210) TaxID=578458 RepID=UPI0021607C4F